MGKVVAAHIKPAPEPPEPHVHPFNAKDLQIIDDIFSSLVVDLTLSAYFHNEALRNKYKAPILYDERIMRIMAKAHKEKLIRELGERW